MTEGKGRGLLPQTQPSTTSFRLVPLRTVPPDLVGVKEKDCLPTPIGMEKEFEPAVAGNDCVLLPEVILTVPAWVSMATRNMESAIESAPLGFPTK